MTPAMLVAKSRVSASRSTTGMVAAASRSPASSSGAVAVCATMPSMLARVACNALTGRDRSMMKSPAMSPKAAAATTAPRSSQQRVPRGGGRAPDEHREAQRRGGDRFHGADHSQPSPPGR